MRFLRFDEPTNTVPSFDEDAERKEEADDEAAAEEEEPG